MRNAVASAAFAILIAGCAGGEDPAARGRTSPSPAIPSPTVDEEAIAEAEADAAECEAEVGDFLEALRAWDSRLRGGLVPLARYDRELVNMSAVADQINFSGLSQSCIRKVITRSQKAFNAYVRAALIWKRCFQNDPCDFESILPRVQKSWLRASRLIRNAEDSLEVLAEPT
jgi:hypothetical protein